MWAKTYGRQTLQVARAGMRDFLETPAGEPIQTARMKLAMNREKTRLNSESKTAGYPILTFSGSRVAERIAAEKRVFILGSGASVMELTNEHWQEVRKSPSIGFGAWPLHRFVPDMLAFEPTRGLSDYAAVVGRVMARNDIVEAEPEVLLLRSSLPGDTDLYAQLPEAHRSRASIYGRVSFLSHTSDGLRRELFRHLKRPLRSDFGIMFDSGSTLTRMISFAIKSGASEIVLLGVDLNTPEYFWESDPKILSANGFESFFTGQSGPFHATMTDPRRPLPVDVVISVIHDVFSRLSGGKISIGSPYSALARCLPEYRWDF